MENPQYNRSMADILVIGSLNADLVVRAPRFPKPGETISGDDLQTIPGGKGANQAVAAARQGAAVSMIGRVGSDSFSQLLLDNLAQNHVNTAEVKRDSSATGTAIIVVDENGQNSIVLSPGANGKVTPADVETASFLNSKLLLLQLEIPTPTVLHAAQRARAHHVKVVLNPAPAKSLPDELLRSIDFLIPNESELSILSGMPVTDIATAESAARALLKKGNFTVIVTLGAKGALIVNETGASIHIPSFPVNAVDTTAAGDAFIGGFAAALLENKSLEECVRLGCACGAIAATKFGAQPSLPTREETLRFIS